MKRFLILLFSFFAFALFVFSSNCYAFENETNTFETLADSATLENDTYINNETLTSYVDTELPLNYYENSYFQTKLLIILVFVVSAVFGALIVFIFLERFK